MPQEKKLVDKFTLINAFGTMMKALEDDMIESGTIYFIRKQSGVFYVRTSYEEVKNGNI